MVQGTLTIADKKPFSSVIAATTAKCPLGGRREHAARGGSTDARGRPLRRRRDGPCGPSQHAPSRHTARPERFAQDFQRIYGAVAADIARGLALQMDNGSRSLSDHVLN